MPMISDETPVLESVFVTHADDATDVRDIARVGLASWMWDALTYRELEDWTADIAAGIPDTL